MQEMMDIQLAKQHREEMLREVELNRQANALQRLAGRRAGQRSTLVWGMKRHVGRLLRPLRT